MTYIGREIAVAGTGLMLHTVYTCGINADVVHIPENMPNISIRFMHYLYMCANACLPFVTKHFMMLIQTRTIGEKRAS